MADFFGFIYEIALLALGIYIYLFAINKLKYKDAELRKKADAFRIKNGWWLRLLSLLLIAMMVIDLYLHIKQLTTG